MPEPELLDTSVLADLSLEAVEALPERSLISTISVAELAAGLVATPDPIEKARRSQVFAFITSVFVAPLPFDLAAAKAYQHVFGTTRLFRLNHRSRQADLFIAAIALAHGLPLHTRNLKDVRHLTSLIDLVPVPTP